MTTTESRSGYETSFAGLFVEHEGRPAIRSIQIPLVQRDYAQGRPGPDVASIRTSFLDVLHGALTGGKPVGLDFVYGDVVDETLLPLDGQQRMTTLFLLHWYLCFRTGRVPAEQEWRSFTYDTRQSARLFCERIVRHPPPADTAGAAAWIVNQHWYLHVWRNDPTITSMRTMIAAIEDRFAGADLEAAWTQLIDSTPPAISFQLLPIDEVGTGDELYIKMNSRGKPLTPFETFKGRFEQTVEWSEKTEKFEKLKANFDGRWSDLLWHLRGEDDEIDDEFLRYLEFVTEIGEWREVLPGDGALHLRAQRIFAEDNERAPEHLTFLFDAFEWNDEHEVKTTFGELFSTEHVATEDATAARTVLFGTGTVATNLFHACCERYGRPKGSGGRAFSLGETLLLYGVLLHRINKHRINDPKQLARRIRVVRNLVEASINELRVDNMPKLLGDVERIVVAGTLDGVATFNQIQVSEERLKEEFLTKYPALAAPARMLEDSNLLRGALVAFELEQAGFAARAEAFRDLFGDRNNWPLLTGALLASGEYQRRRPRSEGYQFGPGNTTSDGVWRDLFTGSREDLIQTRAVLGALLDGFADSGQSPAEYLPSVISAWCSEREAAQELDWRYYLVKYDDMRTGATGIYFGEKAMLGYSLCMLRTLILTGYYRDPFLHTIHLKSQCGEAVRNSPHHMSGAWFHGYPETARWMYLDVSGIGIRCVPAGLAIMPPKLPEHRRIFDGWLAGNEKVAETDDGFILKINQSNNVDTEDRVLVGAAAVASLVESGL